METKRLRFHPSDVNDAAFFVALYNTPKWLKYIGDRNIKTVEAAEQHIKNRVLKQYNTYGYGSYVLTLKETGEKIGNVGLYNRPGLEHADIGFAFLPEFEGQGYGYESASYLLNLAFTKFGLEEVQAITVEENIGSQKLIEKIGLTYQKIVKIPGDEEELLLYSITKKDYFEQQASLSQD